MKFQNVDIAVSQCLYQVRPSGTGHTCLQKQLREHNQETSVSPFKNTIEKKKRRKQKQRQ